MTVKNSLGIALIVSICAAGCKNSELEPQESSIPLEASATVNPPSAPTASSQQPNPQQVAVPQPQQPAAAPVQVAKGMNPAHGQPGHRCDIPVGAPLSTPVQAQKPQPVQKAGNGEPPITITPGTITADGKITPGTGVNITSKPAPANGAPAILKAPEETKPGMNPPHGQAGHRCDIAVGQPLPKE